MKQSNARTSFSSANEPPFRFPRKHFMSLNISALELAARDARGLAMDAVAANTRTVYCQKPAGIAIHSQKPLRGGGQVAVAQNPFVRD